MGAFLRSGFAHVDNVIPVIKTINHMAAPVKVARQQTTPELFGTFRTLRNLHQHTRELSGREPSGTRLPTPAHTGTLRNFPEPSKTFRNLPPEPTPAYTGTLQNRPEPSGTCLRNRHHSIAELSGTFRNLPPAHTGTLRNLPEPSNTFRNLRQHTPEPSEIFRNLPELASGTDTIWTFRNLPEPASGTYTSIRRNPPEPSGTRLRNLHQHTPEPPGTFRKSPPEPTPAHAGTPRNLPEPSSGTCSCDPRRHTPELIWAEDPSSLRCWGNR